ncbi:MAG TPA: hypothetical protein VHV83_11395 [Armatimonadota bacterium]|nr:hypothetical protein [Armatimonadota bacterium]
MKRTVQMIIRIASLLASTACLFSLPGWALPQVTLNYEKPFPAILNPGRIINFVPQSDPVAFGDYIAVIGQQSGSSTNELRVFRMQKLTLENNGAEWDYPYGLNSYTISGAQATKEVLAPYRQAQPSWWNSSSYAFYSIDAHQGNLIDECFSRSAGTGNQWIGTPVFGKIRRNISGTTIAFTVVIALKRSTASTTIQPYCYVIDPYIAKDNTNGLDYNNSAFATKPDAMPTGRLPEAGEPYWVGDVVSDAANAAITVTQVPVTEKDENNKDVTNYYLDRMVVTTFGSSGGGNQIHLYNATNGAWGVSLGNSATGVKAPAVRFTGPASLVTATVPVTMTQQDAGNPADPIFTVTGGTKAVQKSVEFLAVAGELMSDTTSTHGTPVIELIPPTLVVPSQTNDVPLTSVPPDLVLTYQRREIDNSYTQIQIPIGEQSNPFRNANILGFKSDTRDGVLLKITFTNWNMLFTPDTTSVPRLWADKPFSVSFTTFQRNAAAGTQQGTTTTRTVNKDNLNFTMGYPILLRGSQFTNLPAALTLHTEDGDGAGAYNYATSLPLTYDGERIIVEANAGGVMATLRNSLDRQQTPSAAQPAGAVTAYHITHPGLSNGNMPTNLTYRGDIAWQFWGDTLGPKTNSGWRGSLPRLWLSDFPYPAVTDDQGIVYTVGKYTGSTTASRSADTFDNESAASKYVLYAIDQTKPRYLQQVVATAAVESKATESVLNIDQTAYQTGLNTALRAGVRALLLCTNKNTWDLGHVTAIKKTNTANEYQVSFDQPLPTDTATYPVVSGVLLVATSVPYVSHVQAWDAVDGAKPIQQWNDKNDNTVIRQSEGISMTCPQKDSTTNVDPAIPDVRVPAAQSEVMISLSQLGYTCHTPNTLSGTTVIPTGDSPEDPSTPSPSAGFLVDNSWKNRYAILVSAKIAIGAGWE